MSSSLQSLFDRRQLWHARDRLAHGADVCPSGWPALDAVLPGGGWWRGAFSELLSADPALALRLLLPALASVQKQGQLLVAIGLPHRPYAPGWAQAGLRLDRCLLVAAEGADRLWATEQALRHAQGAAVLAILPELSSTDQRRLQLAAQAGNALGLLLRPVRERPQACAAVVRLLLEPAPEGARITCLRRRGADALPAFTLSLHSPPPRWPARPAITEKPAPPQPVHAAYHEPRARPVPGRPPSLPPAVPVRSLSLFNPG